MNTKDDLHAVPSSVESCSLRHSQAWKLRKLSVTFLFIWSKYKITQLPQAASQSVPHYFQREKKKRLLCSKTQESFFEKKINTYCLCTVKGKLHLYLLIVTTPAGELRFILFILFTLSQQYLSTKNMCFYAAPKYTKRNTSLTLPHVFY